MCPCIGSMSVNHRPLAGSARLSSWSGKCFRPDTVIKPRYPGQFSRSMLSPNKKAASWRRLSRFRPFLLPRQQGDGSYFFSGAAGAIAASAAGAAAASAAGAAAASAAGAIAASAAGAAAGAAASAAGAAASAAGASAGLLQAASEATAARATTVRAIFFICFSPDVSVMGPGTTTVPESADGHVTVLWCA